MASCWRAAFEIRTDAQRDVLGKATEFGLALLFNGVIDYLPCKEVLMAGNNLVGYSICAPVMGAISSCHLALGDAWAPNIEVVDRIDGTV